MHCQFKMLLYQKLCNLTRPEVCSAVQCSSAVVHVKCSPCDPCDGMLCYLLYAAWRLWGWQVMDGWMDLGRCCTSYHGADMSWGFGSV
jgi:hypothetical protein